VAIRTPICDLLGIEYPIILGGMMGISDGRLTAAVSEAGGLGTLSTATFGLDGSRAEIEKISELTDKPYSVNLPIFHPMVPKLVELVKEYGIKIVTTSAGNPAKYTKELKDAGVTVIHVVSSIRTAVKAEGAGVDVVVAEGSESGGKVARNEVPTISLIPQVVDAVGIPVIGAGGLADGRGLLAALALGAQGVQLGTRFLATEESIAHDNWKKVLVAAGDSDTDIACRLSSPTRLIRNDFWEELNALDEPGKGAMDFMEIQGVGMARIPGDPEGRTGNYTAGTGSGLIRRVQTAAEVIQEIMADADADLARINSSAR
jgi:enoyl-[acyl-carrier protein] reductase II